MSSVRWVSGSDVWHIRDGATQEVLTNTFIWLETPDTYWVMLDGILPSGRTIGQSSRPALKIAGPFETLDQAKAASLILPRKVIL